MATYRGMSYAEVAAKALEAKEAEQRIVKAIEARRIVCMARRQAARKDNPSREEQTKRKWPQGLG